MRRTILLSVLVVTGVLGTSAPAHAQDAKAPSTATVDTNTAVRADVKAPGTTTSTDAKSLQLRASHRVDVIGNDEKVESIIDRMRGSTGATKSGTTRDARPGGELREPDRRGLDRPGASGNLGNPPSGSGPPGGAGPPPPARGQDAPPPDRPPPSRR